MRFKVDENLPVEASAILCDAGHDAVTVVGQEMSGAADAEIGLICQEEGRVLVTLDTDFADIRAYPPEDYAGLIVLRLKWQDKTHVLRTVERLLPLLPVESPQQRLWIVEETHVRIRE